MKIRLALIRILVVSVLGMSGFIHAGRQSSFAVIPDTQYSGDAAETIAIPLMQDWIWARAKDCNDGIPRDDSTARGCINWMGVVSVGDINNNHTDDYTKWINFYTQFGTLGPDGLGPIPFMTIDGNHDEGHAPDYPACVDEPEPCECGSPVLSKGKYCDDPGRNLDVGSARTSI